MSDTVTLTPDDAHALAVAVLIASGTSPGNAGHVADALVKAEREGIASHGLSRLPAYADQAASGKVDGRAEPLVEPVGSAALRVDARTGFAYPALAVGIDAAVPMAQEAGCVAVAIANSHHFGVAGHPAERLADAGLVGLVFGNSPAAIAPWGGTTPLFGTNPIAFGCPRRGRAPLVIDLSLSKVARGKIMVAAQKGDPIPEGWALDGDGHPTTDARAALTGAMLPMGDAKGAALVLMVELLAAALTGSHFGYEASSFFTADGPPPRVGQFLLAVNPVRLAGEAFLDRVEALLAAMLDQPGTRLPGDRRLDTRTAAERDGIRIPAALHGQLTDRAAAAGS